MTALLGSRGTGQAGRPTRWASVVVRTAALPLPSEHRWRYRQEFLSELYGMTPAEQLHHVTGVLSRVWTLWVALEEPERLLTQDATLPGPCAAESESTAGSGCTTPRVAGTANACPVESNGVVPAGEVSTPSDTDGPCGLPSPSQNGF